MRIILLLLVWSASAVADDLEGPGRYLSALGGYAIATSGSSSSNTTYSGRLGFSPFRDDHGLVSLGAYVGRSSDRASLLGVSVEAQSTAMMGELVVRRAFNSWVYFGSRAGVALVTADVSTSTLSIRGSGNSFAFGPVLGLEVPVNASTSIGVDTCWLSISESYLNFDVAQMSVKLPKTQGVLLQGSLTYHW